MNRRHFVASVSATAILPKPILAAQNTLQLEVEAMMRKILLNGNGADRRL